MTLWPTARFSSGSAISRRESGGVVALDWGLPMTVSFWLSRPALDRLADEALTIYQRC
jgi:hypothetical protein